eukprot:8618150-Alexandrium_andersonii.AAC.1
MARCPRTRTPPPVERQVSRRPAKSVPTYARRVAPSPCHGNGRRTSGAQSGTGSTRRARPN